VNYTPTERATLAEARRIKASKAKGVAGESLDHDANRPAMKKATGE
jgi:hypothetical protein